ncbi:AAA family ATPase [Pseudonocardia sp. TRM90224]|uniref:AAA family ATPase n=1 Tax=Pseudonocardia sp. TRM90224 TaxID=2812678 RepID=UPI001E30CE65|nr:AAA family ATPase [Pseudonocardia sp. TRM90224]
MSLLVTISGLPATGKSTVGRAVANEMSAPYVRIDTIENAIARAGAEVGPLGYCAGYALAGDLLRQGFTVFAESVNALAVTRESWHDVADRGGAKCVDVEFVCSDPVEHERRARTRTVDIPDHTLPTWADIQQRTYEPWATDRVVIDTAGRSVEECAAQLRVALA